MAAHVIRVTFRDGTIVEYERAVRWSRERIDTGHGVYLGDILLVDAAGGDVALVMCDAVRAFVTDTPDPG